MILTTWTTLTTLTTQALYSPYKPPRSHRPPGPYGPPSWHWPPGPPRQPRPPFVRIYEALLHFALLIVFPNSWKFHFKSPCSHIFNVPFYFWNIEKRLKALFSNEIKVLARNRSVVLLFEPVLKKKKNKKNHNFFSSEHERRGGHTGRKFISKIFHSEVSFVYKSKETAANQIIPNVMNNNISISNY